MIPNKLEIFTAKEAIRVGLPKAINRGEAKLNGGYEILPNGQFRFTQNNFTFKDKFGNLRVGRFKDEKELCTFTAEVSKNITEVKEND